MAQTVSDFFWERLYQWGVRRVFGYPGDGINGLLGGLARFGEDKIKFVQVRHEEMAAFMAAGHAKFTGEVGLCYATSGPGAIHLLNGLYDARMDHVPVVAIVGQQARSALGSSYQQEVDLQVLFKDVASEFVATFGLLATIWGVSRRRAGDAPFAVGAYITAAYWFTASTSFANPAVTLARAMSDTFAGIRPDDVPAFIAAQFAGAAAATALFRWLTPNLPQTSGEVVLPRIESQEASS